jgi:hypothetical protein
MKHPRNNPVYTGNNNFYYKEKSRYKLGKNYSGRNKMKSTRRTRKGAELKIHETRLNGIKF